MAISEKVREYDPAQSTDNPTAVAPGWAKIVIALAGMFSTTLGSVLTVGLFPPESAGYKLVVVAMGFLGAVVTAVVFISGETAKEKAKSESAGRIAEAKVQGVTDVAVAQAEASAPKQKPLGFEAGGPLIGTEVDQARNPAGRHREVGFRP